MEGPGDTHSTMQDRWGGQGGGGRLETPPPLGQWGDPQLWGVLSPVTTPGTLHPGGVTGRMDPTMSLVGICTHVCDTSLDTEWRHRDGGWGGVGTYSPTEGIPEVPRGGHPALSPPSSGCP